MDILNPKIEEYLLQLFPINDPVLKKMEERYKISNFPSVGPLIGQFLHQLTIMTKAYRVFEMGSGFGYSALWIAKALPPDGKIICTDLSEENKQLAEKYFKAAGELHKLDFRIGNAIEILEKEQEPLDIIFCDIEKEYYPRAFKIALSKLKQGGLLLADNVLWKGRITDPRINDQATKGVKKFNQLISTTENVASVIIPIRDGLSVTIKLANIED